MAGKPNIQELLAACGSTDLATAFKYLFSCEVTEDRSLLNRLEEERDQLERKVHKRERTVMETHGYGPFIGEAVDGLKGLLELQRVDRDTLVALLALLDAVRDGIAVKERQIVLMEQNEGMSD